MASLAKRRAFRLREIGAALCSLAFFKSRGRELQLPPFGTYVASLAKRRAFRLREIGAALCSLAFFKSRGRELQLPPFGTYVASLAKRRAFRFRRNFAHRLTKTLCERAPPPPRPQLRIVRRPCPPSTSRSAHPRYFCNDALRECCAPPPPPPKRPQSTPLELTRTRATAAAAAPPTHRG